MKLLVILENCVAVFIVLSVYAFLARYFLYPLVVDAWNGDMSSLFLIWAMGAYGRNLN